MPHAATSAAPSLDVPALSPTMTDPEPEHDRPGGAGRGHTTSGPASSSPVLSPARSRRSSRSSSSAMTPCAELPLPPLAAVGAALAKPVTPPREPRELQEYLDDTAFSPFPNLPPIVSLPPLQAHPGSPWARATSPRPPRSPQPGMRSPSPVPPHRATSPLPPPPPPQAPHAAPLPAPAPSQPRQKPALTLPLPPPTLDLSNSVNANPPAQLSNTPTAELGPFEYPAPEPDTPAAKRAASGPVPPNGNGAQAPSKPRAKHRTSTSPSNAAPPAAPTRPLPRPGARGRRGSIASGQISRLAAELDAWPGPARANSSPILGLLHNMEDDQPPPRPARAPSFTATSSQPPVSPTTRMRAKHTRSASGSQTHARRSSNDAPPQTQPQFGSTPPSHRLVPAAPRRGGVIAFSHTPLPAPIPPSLLARRGSVPANIFPAVGTAHRQWDSVYHPPQRPSHARRASQGRSVDGQGSSSGSASASGSGSGSGSASAAETGLDVNSSTPACSTLGTSPPTTKPKLKHRGSITRSPMSPVLDIPVPVHEDEEPDGGGYGGDNADGSALGISPPDGRHLGARQTVAARRRSDISGQRPKPSARDGAASG